ncbi:MAG: HAMP domain-containing histidine kinase [Bacilli bacterium]|nr:HAMP domain-containing histidine kinase [Bacilli bacterium]
MIKTLRIKFILISMLSVFFVLAVTIGAINISNYVVIENNASAALTEVIREGTNEQQPGGGPREQRTTDLRQEHYFVVSFNDDGTVVAINNRQMFMYSEAECKQLASQVFNNELSGGKYQTLRYSLEKKADGLTYVGFLDIREKLDSFNSFLLLSTLISLGAFAALFLMIFFGSKLVFKSTEEAYKKQKRFITNASHELKTPLTIISADIDLIEMDNGKSEWSDSIRDQVKRLNEMTNQLVTLSKLEEDDKSRFPFADFSLNETCNKAVESFSSSFKKEGIKFSSNITGNITMFGNKYLIDELVYIFLDNSLKYTGGEQKSSYFVVSENKGKIQFRFSNTIDKDDEVDIKQIMERFYRSPSNKKEGSGVGLSIAQEIIKFHKGKIDIDKNNNSLTFIIAFNN